jgi:hypothetical protein
LWQLLRVCRYALLEALQEVFDLRLQIASQQQMLQLLDSSSSSSSSRGSADSGAGSTSVSKGAVAAA